MIGLIWVVLKVIRSGVVIYTGADGDAVGLAGETAQWAAITIFWFSLFLVMKLLEYLVNTFQKMGGPAKTKSSVKRLTKTVVTLPKKLRKKGFVRKVSDIEAEERLYEIVEQEIKQGEIRRGLWTKAEATAKSAESSEIRAAYIRLRFEQLQAQELHRHESEAVTDAATIQTGEIVSNPEQQGLKRRKWGRLIVTLGGTAALLVGLAAIANFLYLEYQNRPQVATGIDGIELGMTKTEVTLLKGAPDSHDAEPEWRDDWSGYLTWIRYRGEYDFQWVDVILVGETADELRVKRICTNDSDHRFSGRGYSSSIGVYSSEQEVIEKFGRPVTEEVAEDGLSKKIYFWRWNLYFVISEGEVDVICVDD